MAPFAQERPCIHVAFLPGADESLYRWVQIGAEEEGVPCRLVSEEADTLVDLAYAAAKSSRFNIGIGVSETEVILHEMHMPPEHPVMAFQLSNKATYFCRLMGANAARMIIRKSFRFADEPSPFENGNQMQVVDVPTDIQPPVEAPQDPPVDPALVAAIVAVVVQKLQERGLS